MNKIIEKLSYCVIYPSVIVKDEPIKKGAEALVQERGKTHGDWKAQSNLAQQLKILIRGGSGQNLRASFQEEALEMILVKVSRICCGDPNESDHWDDIAGYAVLGKGHE